MSKRCDADITRFKLDVLSDLPPKPSEPLAGTARL